MNEIQPCSRWWQAYTEPEILATLKAVNAGRCDPSLPDRELETICGSVGKYERGSKRGKVIALDVQEAYDLQQENLPPVRWFVKDLLPQGLSTNVALPKLGKSWWALDLALSVAAGDKFMGFQTEKTEVLYLALEDSKSRLKKRVNILTYGAPAPKGFCYAILSENLDHGLIEQLEQQMTQFPGTGLIIIDTLQKVKGSKTANESAYEADYRQMGLLKRFADKYGIAVLVIHHTKKGREKNDVFESISGTNGILDSVDTSFVIERSTRNPNEVIMHITGRDVTSDDIVLEVDQGACRWKLKGSFDDLEQRRLAEEYEDDPIVRTVKHLLEDSLIWKGDSFRTV